MADTQLPMGEGTISPDKLEAEVRVIRHNVSSLQTAHALHGELIRDALNQAATARTVATTVDSRVAINERDIRGLKDDIYGHQDRKDDVGMFGELHREIRSMRKQQWAVLLALLGVIATGAVDLLVRIASTTGHV